MKNLLKITVVSLSLLAFAQAEALVCPAGQQVYSSSSGSRCIYTGTTGAVAPIAPAPQLCNQAMDSSQALSAAYAKSSSVATKSQLAAELAALQQQVIDYCPLPK